MFTYKTGKRRQRAPEALYKNSYPRRGVFLEALPLIWAAFLIDPGRRSWEQIKRPGIKPRRGA